MRRALNRDAVHREEFYFRKCLVPEGDEEEELITGTEGATAANPPSIDSEYTLMNINTIINGKVRTMYMYMARCSSSVNCSLQCTTFACMLFLT